VRALAAWLPAIVVAAIIFALSAQPHLHVTEGALDLVLRKCAHLTVYALLAMACVRGLAHHGLGQRAQLLGGGAMALTYAISDEFHQTFVPGRSGAPRDVAIDLIGIAAGLLLLSRNVRLRARVAPA
jgi:VanZ family protein